MQQKIDSFRKFLNVLTWTKLFQIFLLSVIFAAALFVWETKSMLFNLYQNNQIAKTIKISNKSMVEMDLFTRQHEIISVTQITSVDFQRNTQTVVNAIVDDDRMKILYNRFLYDIKIFQFPLFSNTDLNNNIRIISLINGDFVCNSYADSLAGHVIPEGSALIKTACSVGIPPEYGKFSGMVTIYLNRAPTQEEKTQLQSAIKALALSIYKNDFE